MIARLRTQQLYIDLPKPDSEPWLNIVVQRVEMDETFKTLNVVDRWGSVNVCMSEIYTNVYPLTDQVPQGYISVGGLAQAITVVAIDLIIKKYGGTVDANGFIIVE